ncbi:MAG: HIT domain-containing protein [Bacteroidetes bacterium]|nr:HIT domain-containing protein [Bacteroidota bacterium]
MASIFSKIVEGSIPCHKVAEDDKHLAFLDIQPVSLGHVLVIPKKETDYIFDLSEMELNELMAFSRKVAIRLKKAVPCKRIAVSVIGLEVPHAHVHLIPINQMDDCNFSRPKLKLSQDQLATVAEKINQIS